MGTISTRVPEEIEAYLEVERLDRSTAVRKLFSRDSRRGAATDAFEVVPIAVGDMAVGARLARHPRVSKMTAAVLTCAAAHDAVAITDGAAARSAADVEGIETWGTEHLVLSTVKRGGQSPGEGRKTIVTMIDDDWYVTPDPYTEIVRTIVSLGSD